MLKTLAKMVKHPIYPFLDKELQVDISVYRNLMYR